MRGFDKRLMLQKSNKRFHAEMRGTIRHAHRAFGTIPVTNLPVRVMNVLEPGCSAM